MLRTQMQYLSDRQVVLSRNMSNLDVPGARAQDLEAPNFQRMVTKETTGLKMAMTNPEHMKGSSSSTLSTFRVIDSKTAGSGEKTPTGNNIAMEEQMMKVAETSAKYQETTAFYKKMMDLMKLATGNHS